MAGKCEVQKVDEIVDPGNRWAHAPLASNLEPLVGCEASGGFLDVVPIRLVNAGNR